MGAANSLTLNAKQIAFVEHPDALLDPRKACRDVGYAASFCANNKPYELRQAHIHVLVEKMRTRLEKLSVTPDWVKNEVLILARTAPSDFLEFKEDAQGNQYTALRPKAEIEDAKWRAAIKKVKFDTVFDAKTGGMISRVSEIVFYDRQKSLMDLAELLGMTNPEILKAQAMLVASSEEAEERKVLESMSEEELEEIARIHEGVRDRLASTASKKRDRKAIDVAKED